MDRSEPGETAAGRNDTTGESDATGGNDHGESTTASIVLRDVRKSYGPTTALDGVSLAFEPGSVHALLGPNGSGKTTLFRVLLGLTRPDAGAVSVPYPSVGCGFQDPQFYEGLTVRENLDLFADLGDAPSDRVETLLERCGLARVAHRRAGAVSAGVASRLDVALALVDRPDVLLLDEPLADVDEEHRSRLRDLLAEYATPDRVLVIATHRFDAFESLFDAASVLDDGRVVDRARDLSAVDDLRRRYRGALDASDPEE